MCREDSWGQETWVQSPALPLGGWVSGGHFTRLHELSFFNVFVVETKAEMVLVSNHIQGTKS